MKTLADNLSQYAAYHRDKRNIATHFVGIPMIVLAITVLLARPALALPGLGLTVTPAIALSVFACLFYLRLSLGFGLVMTALMAGAVWFGQYVAAQATQIWLTVGIGLFVVGWIFQFVGHYYEKRKPAFVDDLVGLLVGPLFIVAEAAFLLGLAADMRQEVEARVGPTLIRT